jgi:hypothetical protein
MPTKKALILMILGMTLMFTGKVYAEQKVFVNSKGITPKSSGGMSVTFPDVCKTPSPGGPIPIPYPNIGKSSDTSKGSKKVKMNGNPIMLKGSNFKMGTGDEAGTRGGGKQEYYKVKGRPKAKPNATENYPRPAYHKYLTPSDN